MQDNVEEMVPQWNFYNTVTTTLEHYGWYLLIATVILGYVYTKISPYINKYFQYRNEQEYAAKYHKDPDVVIARLTVQQNYVSKLQEKYDRDAEIYKRKLEEKEIKKRDEWLQKNAGVSSGSKLGTSTKINDDKSKSLKPEYNPLMGSTSKNYRPPKKSCCSGGGCGK